MRRDFTDKMLAQGQRWQWTEPKRIERPVERLARVLGEKVERIVVEDRKAALAALIGG